ncbi:MAG TPA: hypothetical protein VHL53_08885, partial [Acidimicrobiia bacterium]|nr:hypothetical protein [Acidimicrobiia bacterium]
MKRRLAVVLALVVGAIIGTGGGAQAHNAGRVELLVTNLAFDHMDHDVMVSADLIDRDSGASAAGFAVVVSAVRSDGTAAGPVTLTDPRGTGHYEGMLAAGPGSWTVTAKAEQGTSALPALGSTRTALIKVDAHGVVVAGHGHRGGTNTGLWVALAVAAAVLLAGALLLLGRRSGSTATQVALLAVVLGSLAAFAPAGRAGAQETPNTVPQYGSRPVTIALEVRTDYPDQLPSPLYIPLRARLTDAETGQPVADPYTVRASVRVPNEASKEAYDFAYPHGTVEGAEAGVYNGVVIVPAGGTWTVVVNAYNTAEADTAKLPRSLGVGQIDVTASGAALQTAQGRKSSDVAGNTNPRAQTSEVALLFVHSIVAGLWFALVGVLLLLGLPNRRRLLSGTLTDLAERNIAKLSQAVLWTTLLVWGTGLLNLKKAVAFAPPLSAAQATRLFRLPYARPYTYALYSKIGLYALLTVAALAVVREARRRVGDLDERVLRLTEAVDVPLGRPAASSGPIAFTPRRTATATATRPAPPAVAAPAANGAPSRPATLAFRLSGMAVVAGGGAIVFCVTVLKY